MRKFLISLFGLMVTSCASVQGGFVETKVVAQKFIHYKEYKVQFYDGSVLTVDYELWKSIQQNSEIKLTYARKN